MAIKKKMAFKRIGNVKQLKIETPKDLEAILCLDKALWIATGAPTDMINCDRDFLSFLDSDNNGRIICFEIKNAIKWTLETLGVHSGITQKSPELHVGHLNLNSEDAKKIKSLIKKAPALLDFQGNDRINLDQIRKLKKLINERPDSVKDSTLPDASKNPGIRQFIDDILSVTEGISHPSGGRKAITESDLKIFLNEADLYLRWLKEGEKPGVILSGKKTSKAYEYFDLLKDKIDYYFAYSKLYLYNDNFLLPEGKDFCVSEAPTTILIDKLGKDSIISRPEKNCKLSLAGKINPYYMEDLKEFFKKTAGMIIKKGATSISEKDWEKIKSFFFNHEKWVSEKPETKIDKLPKKQIEKYLELEYKNAIQNLITKNNETAMVMDNIDLTEKLCLFQINLIDFTNNFVSFPHLYSPKERAMFEMGTLIVDGRHLTFSIRISDRAGHSKISETGNIFIIYAKIFTHGGDSYEIAAPVTSGTRGNLYAGKKGVFFDINNNEFDALIVQIIENPIGLSETIFSPFHRIQKLISSKFELMTSSAEGKLDETTTGAVIPPAQKKLQTKDSSRGIAAGGMIMGGSVAVAALGSALAYITKTLSSVDPLAIVIAIFAALTAVIVPASLTTFFKLKKRDLSTFLEGAGWSINARMRLTLKLGKIFTTKPKYPKYF